MSKNKPLQKLELTWIGKGEEPKLEPRILIENPEYSYGDPNTENMLIHGDNLLALKALEQDYAGKIKCIYIDPPYNTGNAFEHYDDGIEHSLWLNLIKPRLTLLRNLLTDDGSIWISIDDDESHYLKVLCDEVFGRKNFVSNVIWEKKYAPQNDAKWFSDSHDHILVYAKNKETWRPNLLSRTEEMNSIYKNPDNDPRGVWASDNLSVKTYSKNNDYTIITPAGKSYNPPSSRCWVVSKTKFEELVNDNRIWFGKDGQGMPRLKRFLSDVKDGKVTKTIWQRVEVGDNQDAKREVKIFNNINIFATPKPEKLIERVVYLASNKGDIVLDSFLGSGTTAAVAHKMGRKYIGIELGEHAKTHCFPRLKAVVDGEQGGISKAIEWNGGGGFKFYTLAPSLLKQDKFGNLVINQEYNADMLAAAMAKQEGFKYQPDEHTYWKQGKSSEHDYIFTTTQFLTVEALEVIHDEMQTGESLLICCKAFQGACQGKYGNITIKKIPQMLLGRCEFGRDDYSLNIINMPTSSEQDSLDLQDQQDIEDVSVQQILDKDKTVKKKNNDTLSLFD
ncbi:MAG: site-specific DNA-methyltransferase [Spirosomaceae bacterium]|jgi:adenine-specific DNA-methyltransferase|nr:site-specific DNA-methyltransferase [Spirosomataceae bacterium]